MREENITRKREKIKKLDDDYQKSVEAMELKHTMNKEEIKSLWEKYADARKKFEEDYNLYSGQVTDFQEQLRYLIDEKNKATKGDKKITYASLAKEIGISKDTLTRYNSGHYAPSINTLMMICMVLKLDLKQAAALLESLGFTFMGTRREHYAYMYLLEHHRGAPIKECNDILAGLHIDERYQLRPRKGTDSSGEE